MLLNSTLPAHACPVENRDATAMLMLGLRRDKTGSKRAEAQASRRWRQQTRGKTAHGKRTGPDGTASPGPNARARPRACSFLSRQPRVHVQVESAVGSFPDAAVTFRALTGFARLRHVGSLASMTQLTPRLQPCGRFQAVRGAQAQGVFSAWTRIVPRWGARIFSVSPCRRLGSTDGGDSILQGRRLFDSKSARSLKLWRSSPACSGCARARSIWPSIVHLDHGLCTGRRNAVSRGARDRVVCSC